MPSAVSSGWSSPGQTAAAGRGAASAGGATPGKAVGLFYIGLAHKGGAFSRKHEFLGTRQQNKRAAAEAALSWLKEYLSGLKDGDK